MKRALTLALALLLAIAIPAETDESNNALSVDSTGVAVTFSTAQRSLFVKNDGAQDVSVRAYDGTETVAIHTHAASGSITIKPSEWATIPWNGGQDTGIGFIGASFRCAAAQSTTVRWFAK